MLHLEINSISDSTIENNILVGENIVNKNYFNKSCIIRVLPSPQSNSVSVLLQGNFSYILTHDQTSENEDFYIVDSVNSVQPQSMLELALMIANLIK